MSNQKLPLFSVVVPVYNVEKYIERCIESLLAQTFERFEVIFVNDGSKDSSVDIIKKHTDPRFRIIDQENMGLAAARNTGINASRGIFIALLDSDDFWMPEKLDKHFKHMQSQPNLDISYCSSRFVDDDGDFIGVGQYPKVSNISPSHIFCRNPVGNGSAAVICRAFLNRISRVKNDGDTSRIEYFDESLNQSEDIEFWVRSALDGQAKFAGIKEALTCYRVNASGLSANLQKQFEFWEQGVAINKVNHPVFFKQWFSLAKAYQERYLARRAIRSGNVEDARYWFKRAVKSDKRIIFHEPGRTLITFFAISLKCLPDGLYNHLQKIAMRITSPQEHKVEK